MTSLPGPSQPRRDVHSADDAFLQDVQWTSSCTDMQLADFSPVAVPSARVDASLGRAKLEGGETDDDPDPASCARLAIGVLLVVAAMSAVTVALAAMDARPRYARKAALGSGQRVTAPSPPPLSSRRGRQMGLVGNGGPYGSARFTAAEDDGETTSTEAHRRRRIRQNTASAKGHIGLSSSRRPNDRMFRYRTPPLA